MTTTPQPKIRDLTRPTQGLVVEVASHPATDLLLTLMAFGWEDLTDYDLGQEWFNDIRSMIGDETRKAIEATTLNHSKIWAGFFQLVNAGPYGESVDEFLDRLDATEASEIRRSLVEHLVDRDLVDSATIESAALGDEEAIAAIVECCKELEELGDDLKVLFRKDIEHAKRDLVGALRGFHAEAFAPVEARFAGSLERDARAKQAMVATMSPERVIEEATNGITVDPGSGVRSVLLIPTVVLRPWVLILEHRETRIFVYPVADEHMTTDPDAPSPWIIKTYKALSDEKRIRVLRRLATGPASFQELVEHLDVAKSTAHHHLRVLRSARLVRVTIGADQEYSLRRGVIGEAAKALEEFVEAGASRRGGEDD
ncbi:MAG: metalloregulator ArsR/SmtB family transcription factor [Acidimicrobiia bacterium]|nr:metalloregulator ArsR/SmtB family transcription factor [Acidimicrobiia bacterium]